MVKILANGDIVPDNDPRAQAGNRSSSTAQPQRRQGGIQHDDRQRMQQARGGSMFEQFNQRLLQAGVPRFNLGQYEVEPIVLVGMLLAFLLLGFKGLLLGAILFFVSKWSSGQQNAGPQQGQGGQPGGGGPGDGRWGGQGHRLGS